MIAMRETARSMICESLRASSGMALGRAHKVDGLPTCLMGSKLVGLARHGPPAHLNLQIRRAPVSVEVAQPKRAQSSQASRRHGVTAFDRDE